MSVILCTAGYDHTIRFWEALSGICSRTIQHPESQVNRLCITPDKKFLAAAGHHVVRLYDLKSTNPNPIMTFEGHTNNVTGVAFHCEGKWMVTSSEDQTVKVWDTRSGSIQRDYRHSHPVNDVVIHPNQGELVSGDRGGNVRVWDLGESKCTHQLVPVEDVSIPSVSVASDGSLLAAGTNNGDVYIWRMFQSHDATSLLPCRVFNAHKDYLTRVLISPDVKSIATCSADHTAKIWKIDPTEDHLEADTESSEDGAAQQEGASTDDANKGYGTPTSNVTERPLNLANFINATGDMPENTDSFRVISHLIAKRKPLPCDTVLAQHQRWVWDCAFSADSAYLVTVSSDHYARLFELSTGVIIRQYNGHHRGIICVALNDYSEVPR